MKNPEPTHDEAEGVTTNPTCLYSTDINLNQSQPQHWKPHSQLIYQIHRLQHGRSKGGARIYSLSACDPIDNQIDTATHVELLLRHINKKHIVASCPCFHSSLCSPHPPSHLCCGYPPSSIEQHNITPIIERRVAGALGAAPSSQQTLKLINPFPRRKISPHATIEPTI
jgi:hypothetical protein